MRVAVDGVGASDVCVWRWCAAAFEVLSAVGARLLGPARRRVAGEAASLRVALEGVGASDGRVWRWCAAVVEGSPTCVRLVFGCQSAGALPGVLEGAGLEVLGCEAQWQSEEGLGRP